MFDKSKIYRVLKGTKLYRQACDTEYKDIMFFGYCIYGTYSSSCKTKQIQIWEATKDFDTFFMIKETNKGGYLLSSIVDIYNSFFPLDIKDETEYLSIKKDKEQLTKITQKLESIGIDSWTCSVENKSEMELCLFNTSKNKNDFIRFLSMEESNSKELSNKNSYNSANIITSHNRSNLR